MKDLSPTMRLAGVDIGTLTCRLLIADLPPGGKLIEVRSERRILQLGEAVDQTKQLSVVAMDRVLQCLKEWREIINIIRTIMETLGKSAVLVSDLGLREGVLIDLAMRAR